MEFLSNTDYIRNICILAHVDHGKTTLADSMIASNGIISHRMAGKMRYLDNRQDEQERGITMKSSSIALKFANECGEKFLINLVDTPGHVDFCGEVSAAVRLCDGALIVIDVVEGICPQTKVALSQAWKEGITPILVLNKIDRLILEQKLDETAASVRLQQLLEQVNAIVATLLTTEIFEDEAVINLEKTNDKSRIEVPSTGDVSAKTSDDKQVYDWASAIENIDDDKYYFMPEKNNVIFACSIDDWAFTIGSMAKILSEKLKINFDALQRTLWGDFYLDMKQKRILKHAQAKAKKTLFTSMILENIWRVYDAVAVRRDKVKMAKICEALQIQMTPRDLNNTDSRYQTKLIMSKWLKLSDSVLESVSKLVPSPRGLSERRVERLLSTNLEKFRHLPEKTKLLKQHFLKCSSGEDAVKVACVSKMIPFDKSLVISKTDRKGANPGLNLDSCSDEERPETIFIAFARIFSGKFKKGDKLYVLGPRHDPCNVSDETMMNIDESKKLQDLGTKEHITVATIENLYLLMGRDLEVTDEIPAGNIVGIQGLDKHLVRTATLSSDIYCPPFNDLHLSAAPILRVAIEPKNPLDMPVLMNGLKLLNQADPCVEVKLQDTGEHVIVATGEVHLQHCLKDLQERYANEIELNVSQPIVPLRETIVLTPKTDMVNELIDGSNTMPSNQDQVSAEPGIIELLTPNKRCKIKIRASPLPQEIVECFTTNTSSLRTLGRFVTSRYKSSAQIVTQLLTDIECRSIKKFKNKLKDCMKVCRGESNDWRSLYAEDFVDRVWSFGPKHSGPNLLVAADDIHLDFDLWRRVENQESKQSKQTSQSIYVDSLISGFQLATQSGPLCEEPMMGVCFTVLEWSFMDNDLDPSIENEFEPQSSVDTDENDPIARVSRAQRDNFGPMSGQIISTVKECCRKSFQSQPQRVMMPMFSCDIQVTSDALGKMYAVLGRRHGRILHGDMQEGSQTFDIKAFIPVIESLDFVSEIRKQTSGMANPQLIFSHFETIDIDPFWTPRTEEEYALYGEKADTENRARKYMNLVRRRKGLAVQEKIVEHGEKQRTIKRNK